MTDFPERFEPGSRLWLGDDEAHLVRVEVVESAPHRVGVRLALARVSRAEGAGDDPPDRFVSDGRFLFVRSDELVEPGEGRYYYHELIGCRVETVDGEDVGAVEAVIRPGPQDLLIVDGGPRGEVFVPVVEAIVREVDRERRRVVIDPPEGLLDVNVTKC
jgi:16S rRNA processing protein RimM